MLEEIKNHISIDNVHFRLLFENNNFVNFLPKKKLYYFPVYVY